VLTTTASGFGRLEQTTGMAALDDGGRQLGRTLRVRITHTSPVVSLMAEVEMPPERSNGISIQFWVRGGEAVFNDP